MSRKDGGKEEHSRLKGNTGKNNNNNVSELMNDFSCSFTTIMEVKKYAVK